MQIMIVLIPVLDHGVSVRAGHRVFVRVHPRLLVGAADAIVHDIGDAHDGELRF